jgi:hypothetical protein
MAIKKLEKNRPSEQDRGRHLLILESLIDKMTNKHRSKGKGTSSLCRYKRGNYYRRETNAKDIGIETDYM